MKKNNYLTFALCIVIVLIIVMIMVRVSNNTLNDSHEGSVPIITNNSNDSSGEDVSSPLETESLEKLEEDPIKTAFEIEGNQSESLSESDVHNDDIPEDRDQIEYIIKENEIKTDSLISERTGESRARSSDAGDISREFYESGNDDLPIVEIGND